MIAQNTAFKINPQEHHYLVRDRLQKLMLSDGDWNDGITALRNDGNTVELTDKTAMFCTNSSPVDDLEESANFFNIEDLMTRHTKFQIACALHVRANGSLVGSVLFQVFILTVELAPMYGLLVRIHAGNVLH